MEKEIQALLDAEQKSETILKLANEKADEIRIATDRSISLENIAAKEKMTRMSSSMLEKAGELNASEHKQTLSEIEDIDMYDQYNPKEKEKLISDLVSEVLKTVFQKD